MNTHLNNLYLLLLCAPLLTLAANSLDSHKAEVSGEQFVVDVIVHSEEPLNAVKGGSFRNFAVENSTGNFLLTRLKTIS
jgi:hypothetical protein